ncbi:MAG TPA: T9SS type A sorting domain-containing protein [Bacteroidales bacterium]|nr:T9SS type A sorting domain-containing protein [Bacteroidales bacterium]
MKILFVIQLTLLICLNNLIGQPWEKNYGVSGRFDEFRNLSETYDGGFFLLGAYDYFPDTRGWLIKVDINGNKLYDIIIGLNNGFDQLNLPLSISQTSDGGNILCTGQGPDYMGDIGVIKLDPCGNLEWCKVFNTPVNPDWGVEIKQLQDGGYILLTMGYNYPVNNPRIHLFRLNPAGEVLWIEPYATTANNPYISYNDPYDLVVTPDEDFFISGFCYWCDEPAGTGGVNNDCRLKAMAIFADSNRQEEWVSVYRATDTLAYSDAGWSTQQGSGHFYIGAIDRSTVEYSPSLIIMDSLGNIIHDSIPQFPMVGEKWAEGFMVNPSFTSDGRLFTNILYADSSNFYPGWFGLHELDSLGGWHKSFIHPTAHAESRILVTSDDKILAGAVVGSGYDQDIILMKFNTNLEYDSIYTAPREYDYLCPEPIVSKTIDLSSCEVIVDVKDIPTRKEYEARVSLIPITPAPNPAGDYVRFLLENTEYHTKIRVVCYDIQGRQLAELPVNSGIHETGLDVSRWRPGMYMAVVYAGNKQMGKARFVVE